MPRHRTRRPLSLASLEDRCTPAAGALDPTFGTNGQATVSFGPTADAGATAVALQPDGKILLAGQDQTASGSPPSQTFQANVGVARLTADGAPDPTFGTGGQVVIPRPGSTISDVVALAARPDGTILVVGNDADPGSFGVYHPFVERLTPGGAVDPTFGTGGQTLIAGDVRVNAAAVQPDGSIVLAGDAFGQFDPATQTSSPTAMLAVRLTPAGALDPTFGTGGETTVAFGGNNTEAHAAAVTLLPGGQIVLAGDFVPTVATPTQPFTQEFAAARLTPAGALDTAFGNGGRVVVSFGGPAGSTAAATGVVVQPAGGIVLTGRYSDGTASSNDTFAAARLTPGGALDPSFGTSGTTQVSFAGLVARATSAAVQGDGKVVVAGFTTPANPQPTSPESFVAARLTADGAADPTFGTNGQATVPFGSTQAHAEAVAIQPDGRIVLAGDSATPTAVQGQFTSVFAAARLLGDPPVSPPPPPPPPPTTPPVTPPPPPATRLPSVTAVGADAGGGPFVQLVGPDGTVQRTFAPFDASFTGGVRTATADFNGDGVTDVVAGTGPGVEARVRVLDGKDGHELFAVTPFAGFTGGVFVAAGDITGDGTPDLIITPDLSGGPRVRIFNGAGFGPVADFFGINDPAFRGGARAAVGDIDGDGKADLIVAAGFGGGPRVAVFSGAKVAAQGTQAGLTADTVETWKLVGDFIAFDPALRNGVYVGAGDVDGDGKTDLVFGAGPGGGPEVRAVSGAKFLAAGGPSLTDSKADPARLADFFAGDVNNRGGVRVALKNLDNDSRADLVVGSGTGGGDRVTAYAGKTVSGNATPPELKALDSFPGFSGGVFVG